MHDAHSLRLAFIYAVEQGWRPSIGGDEATVAVIRAAKSIEDNLRLVIGRFSKELVSVMGKDSRLLFFPIAVMFIL